MTRLLVAPLVLALAVPAYAQLRPPSGGRSVADYTLHDFAAKWMMQQDDIAELNTFADANRSLLAENDPRPRTVFIGDSITAGWKALEPHSTASSRWVNRGIGGSNTSQMLLRFQNDAVALKPDTVVIMGGTNDLRAYVGAPASVVDGAFARVTRNIAGMADMAAAHRLRVVLCAVPPVGRDLDKVARDPAGIRRINVWLSDYAKAHGYGFLDYGAVLADEEGYLIPAMTNDGIHPTIAGYEAMLPLLEAALAHPPAASARHSRR